MRTLYISQQGCYVCLQQESLLVKQRNEVVQQVALPLLEQVLVFGQSQLTTQAIRACLWRDIPVAYLSRMGYCYGRLVAIERGYRQLARYQQTLEGVHRLVVARRIVQTKLHNSRVLLMRQQRRQGGDGLPLILDTLQHLAEQAGRADNVDRLMGLEGAGAAAYFEGFGQCLRQPEFTFVSRSRRPPGNPVNAMLSFGYQVLWNHLLSLIELQGLDPYYGCLHEGNYRHAALASDLVEEFRAPLVDSLVLWLVNTRVMDVEEDFKPHNGGCYLNNQGRRKFLKAWLQRMEESLQTESEDEAQPRWDLLNRQVKAYKQFVYAPVEVYTPYRIR
ncbi:CRISPR-associated endonuclease Cas1 (plasmid) [Leptolyngbya sp. BL0902]|uniref:CRISPR-associated endonuclease Cas1 n=1 Tax=Leptolyngbya sp. BL0902 TaxID=1115757 RepID=UPI0018E74064|nr:CRISPR-associated endonuclease Cas1 [Leptolyngbya sp. BL0902]QQE67389.1 CRISPR-associated endonuclease Cas1 [Leptolyngbya sp. BL0902]